MFLCFLIQLLRNNCYLSNWMQQDNHSDVTVHIIRVLVIHGADREDPVDPSIYLSMLVENILTIYQFVETHHSSVDVMLWGAGGTVVYKKNILYILFYINHVCQKKWIDCANHWHILYFVCLFSVIFVLFCFSVFCTFYAT